MLKATVLHGLARMEFDGVDPAMHGMDNLGDEYIVWLAADYMTS